ncbi:MAG TPA: rod shape-determining protein MreD [Thiolapillus brandeum]|uniref:Rod shape-determining protein MreD n=1 Tax=Thiolapillus brandeum TaxID=1076588 RepID=A0A7C5J013_9GAMM|nr:rod shape-determining protein MreD [Thiolapillus brandeum]
MRGYSIILATLLISLVLSVLPMPENLQLYRVQWTALVLVYWCMAVPEKVGVGFAFVTGLLLDILTGTLLGQHALGLSVVGFITLKTYRRVRVFPLWQQSVFVVALLVVERLLFFWVDGTIGRPAKTAESWMAPLLGGLIWPWLFIVMRDLRRRFHTP